MARQVLTLLVLAILLGACGSLTSTPEPTPLSERLATPSGVASPTPGHVATLTRPPPTVTSAPMPTATPTEAPPTQTPVPSPTPSPSIPGEIAFDTDKDGDREIYIVNADGSNLRQLTDNNYMDGLPDWSPDGTQIVFESDRDGDREIYVMDADGNNIRQLTDNQDRDSLPDWSPDGSRIAFVSDRDGNFELYVLDLDSTGQASGQPRRLTDSPDKDWWPEWSPDGTRIAFTRLENYIRTLFVLDVSGSSEGDAIPAPKRVARDAGFAAWSPDGTQFAFSAERDNNVELYVMDADGRNARRLTTSPGLEFVPSWSPDGHWIAFSKEEPKANIYLMSSDGAILKRLISGSAQDWSPVWRPWPSSAEALEGAGTGLQDDSELPRATPDGDRTPTTGALGAERLGMVYVAEGEFLMGSDTDTAEEKPAHTVYLDAFWIDRTEVTYAQFVRFLNHLGGHEGQCGGHDCNEMKDGDKNSHMLYQDGQYVVEAGYGDYPMSEVTWYGAQAYCHWVDKRLPTEAEWEKAARGIDGRRYPWGNSAPNCARVNFRTCVRSTITVASYPAGASPYGALDMAGNVYEWTADWYDREYYESQAASQPNPLGPASGRTKVARGGSSYDLDLYLIRTTYRFGYVPETGHRVVGFRCAAQPPSSAAPPTPIDPAATVAPAAHNDEWLPVVQDFDDVPMALVPPGCFLMGSEDGGDNEQPVHEHCFDRPFWIDVTEVTNVQYGSEGHFAGIDRPRDTVTWFEAAAHCSSRGARLPTEAEWEYAARGPDGLSYPWGTEFAAHNVFFADNSLQQSWDVGLRPAGASWVGALNMSGNLWEWVSSLLEPYPYDSTDGREVYSADDQGQRVLRGGSWESDAALLRTTYRYADDPYAGLPDRGFRCVRDHEP